MYLCPSLATHKCGGDKCVLRVCDVSLGRRKDIVFVRVWIRVVCLCRCPLSSNGRNFQFDSMSACVG